MKLHQKRDPFLVEYDGGRDGQGLEEWCDGETLLVNPALPLHPQVRRLPSGVRQNLVERSGAFFVETKKTK